jgi:NAD(P)-dependent dehydrogenase (short-subunit alcohol dehydrogenase family)
MLMLRASRDMPLTARSGRLPRPASATKWAVSGDRSYPREELRGSGIRVTLIEPGMVDTTRLFFDVLPPPL